MGRLDQDGLGQDSLGWIALYMIQDGLGTMTSGYDSHGRDGLGRMA